MITVDEWVESQEFQIRLDAQGKIIDYLDSNIRRENKPEERIRQKTARILVEEFKYSKEQIALERAIKIGRDETKRADIVIYANAEAKASNRQGEIYLIAEIKAPNIKEPDNQLISYLIPTSAQGGFWTNGERIIFYRREKDNTIRETIGIPRNGEPWDAVGKYKKSDLIVPVDLKLAFKRCHNAMYRSGNDSEDVALDMTRILLAKHEDEESADETCQFRMTQEEYDDPIKRTAACKKVRDLFNAVKERYPDVFSESEEITVSDEKLAIVISQLQQYSFLESPYDVIGTAYEVYVASHLKGERGQHFTNRLVVSMMVRMVDPDDKSIILDPSCGSGGFLISSMNYIIRKIKDSKRGESAKEVLRTKVVHNLFGIDISPKLVKIAKANMLLGKDGHGGIERVDSLNETEKLSASFCEKCGFGKPNVILSNPPFGSGNDIRIKNKTILGKFDIGHTWNVNSWGEVIYDEKLNEGIGVAPELLFTEQYLKWIKQDGLICIVMAKGQLDNREALAIRRKVLSECELLAVINLHEDTFEPFCGSKASVLLMRKCDNPPKDYRIFMAISNKVGQNSRGETMLKKDANGEPIVVDGHLQLDEDLTDIAECYHQFVKGELVESEFRFSVSVNDLDKASLSFNPIHYLPKHNEALKKIIMLNERDDFDVIPLSQIAQDVFNGPRFKRPYADQGVTNGDGIRKFFTGTAITQLNSDNVKYLDEKKCNRQLLRQLEKLTIHKGYILISDSGTLGRISYVLSMHDGHVATNNLIRVVIDDENLRGYVYQFLKSPIGQSLILKNAYGTNQEHLEPDVISEILIPIPKDRNVIDNIGSKVIASIEALEQSIAQNEDANNIMKSIIA